VHLQRSMPFYCLIILVCVAFGMAPTRSDAANEAGQLVDDLMSKAGEARHTDPRLALELYSQAHDQAVKSGLNRQQIEALTCMGNSCYLLSEYQRARDYYQESHDLAEKLGDRKLLANALNNLGMLHYVWGEHDKALDYYLQALAIRLDMDDARGLGQGYNNVATIYHTAGDYEQALTHYQRSLEFYESEADTTMIISSLNNIGLAYYEQKQYDRSLNTYARSLNMATNSDNKSGMAMTLNNMGQVYEARESLDEALARYEQSLTLRRELSDRQGISVCLHNIGTIHVKKRRYDLGIEYLRQALALTEELQIRELTRDNLETLAGAYETVGDSDQALAYYKRYKVAHDDLFSEERSRQIAMAQTRFEVDLKDREIQVLKKEKEIDRFRRQLLLIVAGLAVVIILLLWNRYLFQRRAHREISQKNEALRATHDKLEQAARDELAHVARVATMGELAAAFAHELNQPLAAIRANSRAGQNFLDRPEPDTVEVGGALSDIGEDAERAQEIIIRLRDMMRKREFKQRPVDLNQVLADAVAMIQAEAKRWNVELDLLPGANLPRIMGDRIQLQQVVLNLLQNGMAVMGNREGALTATTERTADGGVKVAVRDAGPPVEADVLADMFEPFFTTKRDGLGMGLPICRTIIEAHGGCIQAERHEAGGLTVGFELPGRDV
jgi:signal transduction histidine kinase